VTLALGQGGCKLLLAKRADSLCAILVLSLLAVGLLIEDRQYLSAAPAPVPVTIGHFAHAATAVDDFGRYLQRNGVAVVFKDFGTIGNANNVVTAAKALNDGLVDVLWLTSADLAYLSGHTPLTMKIGAVTDFPVVHVITDDASVRSATDAKFGQQAAEVLEGDALYADTLFSALDLTVPRCLSTAARCVVLSGGASDYASLSTNFKNNPSSSIIGLWAVRKAGSLAFQLLRADDPGLPRLHLVNVPDTTVVKMATVNGAWATATIPKGSYGIRDGSDVPASNIPTAAAPIFTISTTPPEVVARVRAFIVILNGALLDHEPRMSPQELRTSLLVASSLHAKWPDRVYLHDEFANQLRIRNLSVPGALIAPPEAPTTPSPAPVPRPEPPSHKEGPGGGGRGGRG